MSNPLLKLSQFPRAIIAAVLVFLFLPAVVPDAGAQDRLCDPGGEDCRQVLIDHIRAENVGLDVAFWFMEDSWMATEVINRWKAGVPVRILVDPQANGPNPLNAQRLAELKAAGIPMRQRKPGIGILHWKTMIFAGQGIVEFSGANYSSDAWLPATSTPYENYVDEVIYFSRKTSVVHTFMTKYDDLWTNTAQYADYANITRELWRVYPTYPFDPELNFSPVENYRWRALDAYAAEAATQTKKLDVIMYRITDRSHTDKLLELKQQGLQIRLITDPQQYRDPNRLWHSWNVDRLYMAGIPIKWRKHAGLNHQKSVLLYGRGMSIFGSSNWTSPSADSQEEHNYFTTDPVIFQWLVDQFERKWNNLAGVIENEPFTPLPPRAPDLPSPAYEATGVGTTNLELKWDGSPWAHNYDVYFGTSPGSMQLIAENRNLGPSAYYGQLVSVPVPFALQPGTKYYWQVVGKTMANLTATSGLWTFTTAGDAPPPPPLPAPWASRDIGAVGIAGSTSVNNNVFTVNASGADVWGTADELHFVWQQVSGDVDIIARVPSVEYVNAWTKAGVMIRETMQAGSAHAFMLVSPGKGLAFQRRTASGGTSASTTGGSGTAPAWVKLERRANVISAYRSADGVTWTLVGQDTFTMGSAVYVGLAVSSHDNTQLATATFDNVSVTLAGTPPPTNVAPTVSLTSPTNGASFTAPATITLAATAADSDGSVAKVEFYSGTTLIGTDTTSPYETTWSNVAAGSYTVTARATDNQGSATTSGPVSITVNNAASLPAPWTSQDVGAVGVAGNASESAGTFTVRGSGADVWGSADAFHYVWQQMTGDVDVVARVASVENVQNWTKAGVMIRESLTAGSAHAFMLASPGKGLAFQRRLATGDLTSLSTSGGAGTAPVWVKLERRGNTITAYRSADGASWTTVGSDTFAMAQTVLVGLAVSSHDNTRLATATFDQVSALSVGGGGGTVNAAPSVALTSPSNGATYTAPASISLAATASDSDGTIARVEFYAGTTLLGTTTSSPYQTNWTDIPAGTYSLTAKAFDNLGAATVSAAVSITVNAASSLPAGWSSQDIGAVALAGSATATSGTFSIDASGADIWGTADAFHYVWQPVNGDVDVVARVASVQYVDNWTKAGVMIRESLTAGSAHGFMLVSAGKGLAFQRRRTTSGDSFNTSGGAGTAPAWVKLERRGDTITAYRSADGVTWTAVGSDSIRMAKNVYVGLALTSHSPSNLANAKLDNVSVTPR